MKRMIDQALFEKASSDIKEIQDVLSGKAFFDGNITVQRIGADYGIKRADIPTKDGVYKSSYGTVLMVSHYDASTLILYAIYDAHTYTKGMTIGAITDFKFIEDNRTGDRPIYYHPISIFNNEGLGFLSFVIIDNSPTAYTKETLVSKLANFSRVSPLSGAIINNSKTLIAAYGWQSGNAHYILGLNTDGTPITGIDANNSLEDFINLVTSTVADGVNRIN